LQVDESAEGDPVLDLHRPGEATDQQSGTRDPSAHREHVPNVGVGGSWLHMQVVAIVPPRHQTQVAYRGVASRPGANHDVDVTP
jgi:hypothetical protein